MMTHVVSLFKLFSSVTSVSTAEITKLEFFKNCTVHCAPITSDQMNSVFCLFHTVEFEKLLFSQAPTSSQLTIIVKKLRMTQMDICSACSTTESQYFIPFVIVSMQFSTFMPHSLQNIKFTCWKSNGTWLQILTQTVLKLA